MKNYVICFLMVLFLSNTDLHSQSNSLKSVKIGKQLWTSENLNVSSFRNGEAIPFAKDKSQWLFAVANKIPAYCYMSFDQKYEPLGKLYNWFAVNDSRGLAPIGYHVPSDAEWTILEDFLGGRDVAGKKLKKPSSFKISAENSSGFNGIPVGDCEGDGGHYYINKLAFFWTSTEKTDVHAWLRFITTDGDYVDRRANGKFDGYSVRCIKD